jgi:hypothetical protein
MAEVPRRADERGPARAHSVPSRSGIPGTRRSEERRQVDSIREASRKVCLPVEYEMSEDVDDSDGSVCRVGTGGPQAERNPASTDCQSSGLIL